jgi:hypothetical protein
MTPLQRTGFFREMPHGEPSDPSLAEARQATPAHHEDRVVRYLEAGHVYMATPGPTPDVFAPGTMIGPPHYVTDGTFVWPGDLAHYVRTYHVRLDGRFLEHMLASGWTVPAEIDLAVLALPSSDGTPNERTADSAASVKPDEAPDPATSAPSAKPPDLAAAVADLLGALSDAVGADAESRAAVKQSFEEASAGVARAAQTFGQEIRTALGEAGAKLGAQLSASLRGLNDWLDKPDSEKTEQLQAMMASLEARLDSALAPERLADQAERAQRLSRQIRDTIAQRLRDHGLEPADPDQSPAPAAPADPGASDASAGSGPGTPAPPAKPDDEA